MNESMQVYLSAWPTVWAMDTARYLVGATLMATIRAPAARNFLYR